MSVKDFVRKHKSVEIKETQKIEPPKKVFDPYKILSVPENATESEIKKAYRKMQMQLHPDKGGTPEQSSELIQAYNILIDSEKKTIYDAYGMDGIDEHNSIVLLGDMIRLTEAILIDDISVTLEECYTGTKIVKTINRNMFCTKCNGNQYTNMKLKTVIECTECNKTGLKKNANMRSKDISKQVCEKCNGLLKIYIYEKTDKSVKCCKNLTDAKKKSEKKDLEIIIPPGFNPNKPMILRSMGNQIKIGMCGDIQVTIKCIKHELFKRELYKPKNLSMNIDINLSDALCSTIRKKFTFLDGTTFKIRSKRGEILKHEQSTMIIKGRGMPYTKDDEQIIETGYGDLYINFKIIYPVNHFLGKDRAMYKKLKEILETDNSHEVGDKQLEKLEKKQVDTKDLYYINPVKGASRYYSDTIPIVIPGPTNYDDYECASENGVEDILNDSAGLNEFLDEFESMLGM